MSIFRNIWQYDLTGATLHLATGSYSAGDSGRCGSCRLLSTTGDWFAKDTRLFWPRGTLSHTVHPPTSPAVAVLVDTINEKIGLNRIRFSADDVQKTLTVWRAGDRRGFVWAGDWCAGRLRRQSRSATGGQNRSGDAAYATRH